MEEPVEEKTEEKNETKAYTAAVPPETSAKRPNWTHTFPKSLDEAWRRKNKPDDPPPRTISIREIEIEDELGVANMVIADQSKSLSRELVKRSIMKIDGKPVKPTEVEAFFEKCSYKHRELVSALWSSVHQVTEGEVAAFFASPEVSFD